jgi:hypothetical protein
MNSTIDSAISFLENWSATESFLYEVQPSALTEIRFTLLSASLIIRYYLLMMVALMLQVKSQSRITIDFLIHFALSPSKPTKEKEEP